jgi:hypothetical protein
MKFEIPRILPVVCAFSLFAVLTSVTSAAEPLVAEIDLRTHTGDEDAYYVQISAAPGGISAAPGGENSFPHAYVVLGKEDSQKEQTTVKAFGQYPKAEALEGTTLTEKFGPLPGDILDELEQDRNLQKDAVRLIMRVSKDQYQAAERVRKEWESKGEYQLLKRDCVTFVSAVAEAIGLMTPPRMVLPDAFVRELLRWNGGYGDEQRDLDARKARRQAEELIDRLKEKVKPYSKTTTTNQRRVVERAYGGIVDSMPGIALRRMRLPVIAREVAKEGARINSASEDLLDEIDTQQSRLKDEIDTPPGKSSGKSSDVSVEDSEKIVFLEDAEKEAGKLVDKLADNVEAKGELEQKQDQLKQEEKKLASLEKTLENNKKFVEDFVQKLSRNAASTKALEAELARVERELRGLSQTESQLKIEGDRISDVKRQLIASKPSSNAPRQQFDAYNRRVDEYNRTRGSRLKRLTAIFGRQNTLKQNRAKLTAEQKRLRSRLQELSVEN